MEYDKINKTMSKICNYHVFPGLKRGAVTLVQKEVRELKSGVTSRTTFRELLRAISDVFEIEVKQLTQNTQPGYLKRKKGQTILVTHYKGPRLVQDARVMAYLIAHGMQLGNMSQIANWLGRKNHTSLLHGVKTGKDLLDTDDEFRNKYRLVMDRMGFNA